MNDALKGKGILVTRPTAQSGDLTRAITHSGGTAYYLPVIDIVPRDSADVSSELAALPVPDIAIFVSRNAVLHGAKALRGSTGLKIAAIGPATRSALSDAGLETDIFPAGGFDSEHLLEHPALESLAGKQVLIVRGDGGRELLADTLRLRGATVNYLATYARKTATPDGQQLSGLGESWREGAIDVVIVMSVDSLTSLLKILPADFRELLRKTRLVTPSKRVIQTATELLPGVQAVLADSPQAEGLVGAITQMPQ